MTKRKRENRKGSALIAALVCLVVVSTMMLSLVHSSLAARRQLRNEHQMEQVRWLLDAGVRKGLAELQKNPEYSGGSLTLSPTLNKFSQASVNIQVDRTTKTENDFPAVKLRVDVRIAHHSQTKPAMKRSKEISVKTQR